MSQGAVFRLVLRDPRFDQALTATDHLQQRLARIRRERAAEGKKNPQPTFCDLSRTHLYYLQSTFKPFVNLACEYTRVSPTGEAAELGATGNTAGFTFPIYGDYTSDMVFRVRIGAVGTQQPIISSENPKASPRYRYCAYPGIRLFKSVEFRSAETLIDDYTRDEMSFQNKFGVPQDRRAAWDRGLGQGEIKTSEYYNNNGFTGVLHYRDGPQTPQFYQPPLELWVPLQFWMCGDPSAALLNDLIPNTQRQILANLAPLKEIIQAIDQNSGEVIPLPIKKLNITLELYVNNIYVNPEVHDIFASRVGLSLIRVHRRQTKTINTASQTILLDQLKYPTERLYFGFRDRRNSDDFDYWHLFGRPRVRTDATALLSPAAIWNSTLGVCQVVCRSAKETGTLDPIAERIKLTAHGIELYPEVSASFFNTYLPQRYFAGTAIIAPEDTSAYLATFCLYPGQSNPSGYYNLSTGRELNLTYHASTVTASAPADLVVSATALNFLVRRGDGVRLRYST